MDSLKKSVVVGALASAVLGGCATIGGNPNDPCDGAQITPHSPYNRAMARNAAGLAYRSYNSPWGASRWGFNSFGKPSEAVYTIRSVNGATWDVTLNNSSSGTFSALGLFAGAAALSGVGGGLGNTFAIMGGAVVGASAGEAYGDRPVNDAMRNRTTQCFNQVAAGYYDYTIPYRRPQGAVLVPTQADGYPAYDGRAVDTSRPYRPW